MTFAVGASDAEILFKEFAEVFTQNDLVNLGRFQIAAKMTIDSQVTRPFVATTLPLPISNNENREKVIQASREHWTKITANQEPVTGNFGSQTPVPATAHQSPQPHQRRFGGPRRFGKPGPPASPNPQSTNR